MLPEDVVSGGGSYETTAIGEPAEFSRLDFAHAHDGELYLERFRALVSELLAWGLTVSDETVGALDDPVRKGALTVLAEIGELEIVRISFDGNSRRVRFFERRKLS